MKQELYIHQTELIKENPHTIGVAFGCGMGKTRTVIGLSHGKGTVLIVAPKTTIETKTWETEMNKVGLALPAKIMSKEKFKKGTGAANVLILDEAHVFLGVRPETRYKNKIEIPRTSDLFEEMLKWVKIHRPGYIYMASATPIPTPMAIWAVSELLGYKWDFFAFRRRFYTFLPRVRRGIWVPKEDKATEAELMTLARKFWCFKKREDSKDMPALQFKTIKVGLSSAQKAAMKLLKIEYPDPMARIAKMHQVEQGGADGEEMDEYKTAEIIELGKEFPKMLVFARYTSQIDRIEEKLKKAFKGRDILIMDGRTKNKGVIEARANDVSRETIVIAQTQVSSSYNLPDFRCVVFASTSHSFVDYEQGLGRNQRSKDYIPSIYIHIVAGPVDDGVFDSLNHKKDFSEELFANKMRNEEARS